LSSDLTLEYLSKRLKILMGFNNKTKSSLKFGINTLLKLIQNEKSMEILICFIFHDENLKLLIDMIILKTREKPNIKLYILDKNFKSEFVKIFKVKKLLAFTIVQNEANSQLFKEIIEKFVSFEQNKCSLLYDSTSVVKEISNQI
jgi:hypothetical protein